tara:strand:- start:71 stop:583 length:513 start_codon:yes stop_codon:yes gene_type:complete
MENHKNKIYYILFISLALLFQNCELFGDDNDTPQLPEVTQSGKNTFGFILNGETVNIRNTSNQTAIYQGGGVQFGAGGVYIVVLEPFTTNIPYEFKDIGSSNARAEYKERVSENVFCIYEESDTYQGSVTFTKIDKVNYIISGTFEFSTKKDGCKDIKITNGRFDLRYIP